VTIRYGETDRIPLKYGTKSVWFVLLDLIEGQLREEQYTQTKKGLNALYERLQKDPEPLRVFAVWHGQWQTDLFACEVKVLLERLDGMKKQGEF
jgi:alpha-mannosidase